MKAFWIGLIIIVGILACNGRPSGVLEPKKMQDVLTDIIKADVFTQDFITKDTSLKPKVENAKLQKQIFAKHKVSREEFYKSYDYYLQHSDDMIPILDSIFAIQNRPQVIDTSKKIRPLTAN